jgi:phosphoenolpyruvate carboxykinase (ATP)
MSFPVISFPTSSLVQLGLQISQGINYQSTPEELIQDTLRLGQGVLNDTGALVIRTGEFTGRSPKDRFIVKDDVTANTVDWNDFNQPISPAYYPIIRSKMMNYLAEKSEIWIRDAYACADENYQLRIRIVNEHPWSNLFAHHMFIRPSETALDHFKPDWHIITAPGLFLDPQECGVRQHNATIINFASKTILIAGSGYTGEIKKAIFSVLNYLLPAKGVLSMHCAANRGRDGDTALFFGLSGTGKTTLSADPAKRLIGDDEHGWSNEGIFNIEGGCYAKTINLDAEKEPQIYHAIADGALLENVIFLKGTNKVDYANNSVTENTRVSYPVDFIENAADPSVGPHPRNIFLLTCDAYGVLPPISKLSPGQAMYQFISGYTAKMAGTEAGIKEPKSTFSACFGAPFIPLHPAVYARMLGKNISSRDVDIWLVNTGWTGGGFEKGTRIRLSYTRALITAALNGKLKNAAYHPHPVFGMLMPASCPGVPEKILNPKDTWEDQAAYDEAARKLADLFIQNFKKYESAVTQQIREAGPVL